jgi:1-acyl-sn-glycerol-3-phosphate acyltransferase
MSLIGLPRQGLNAVAGGISAAATMAAAAATDLVSSRPEDPLDDRDPDYIRATKGANLQLVRLYFRPQVRGLEHIPADGPVLLVGNHSGGTWIADTFVFAYEFYEHFGADRPFYQLAHDLAAKMPGLSALIRKYGTLAASHENAERALDAGAALLVYPGGDWESFRPSWHSDEIEFGGRSGFIRLAMSKQVPIVPVVAIGGQETAFFVTRGEWLAKLLQLDRLFRLKVLPIQIAPPFGVTVLDLPGRIPLPSQITIQVLPKIELAGGNGASSDEDALYDEITSRMQSALDVLAKERDLPLVGDVRRRG